MNAAPLHVLYGGTFDPVHCGHLAVARAARDALGAEVALMPAADPPHRPPPGASAEHRARMLELALAGEPGLRVDRRELQRTGRSYSVDTLLALRAELGADAPVALLVGADSFRGLPTWHRWRELLGLAHFVVAERPGSPLDRGLDEPLASAIAGRLAETPAALRAAPAGRIWRLQQPLRPESASELRRRIAAGEPWRDWVPAMVAEYIERHGLYRPTAGAAPPAPV
ncbi:nicotinate-nucleotide adenylyltransferase [Vulcaniibacterium gelatinicum]|uniref:nicotinate-nucleotide adenylyltransferase n=1 Tax=Vulcaniibacterium gelatinicum TaxID=2598725 RepID=UPI0011CBEB0B|nr:nicotinate-nucleotide adenylyltransferase [Vulcaniibacterium gelatinicum]